MILDKYSLVQRGKAPISQNHLAGTLTLFTTWQSYSCISTVRTTRQIPALGQRLCSSFTVCMRSQNPNKPCYVSSFHRKIWLKLICFQALSQSCQNTCRWEQFPSVPLLPGQGAPQEQAGAPAAWDWARPALCLPACTVPLGGEQQMMQATKNGFCERWLQPLHKRVWNFQMQ